MKQSKHLYLLLVLAFCASCNQYQKEVRSDTIKVSIKDTVTAHGPTTMVRNMKLASDGTVLITAVYDGILRYDGKSFTNFTRTIGTRRFWDVLEDRHGAIWITTTDSGLYVYKDNAFRHFTTRDGLVKGGVLPIYEDNAGIIWLGTKAGLSRYDGKSFQYLKTKEGRDNNDINRIFQDRTGKLWIGTRGETFIYDGKAFTSLTNEKGEAFTNVWSFVEDKKGNIWFGGSIIKDKKGSTYYLESGLWRYDGHAVTKVSKRGASSLMLDKAGNIWTAGSISPSNGGEWVISRYDKDSLYDENPSVNQVFSIPGPGFLGAILEAPDGGILFAAMGPTSGVYRWDGKVVKKL